MTEFRDPKAETHFSQPVRQITFMMLALAFVGAVSYIGMPQIIAIYWSNPYLNGLIGVVFAFGLLSCLWQVVQLMFSVGWIEDFARSRAVRQVRRAPSMLAPLATLLRSRGATMQISSSSSRSILDSVAQRIDEGREITRYLGNTLIFLGLLGTFYGLATTVPALVETIRSLNAGDGESGADIFARLQSGLEAQLGGMGTAFSSSLLGLAGSLVVGLLEIIAARGQNRFYGELEEWLSTITRLGFASGDDSGESDTGMLAQFAEHLSEQMEAMQTMFTQSDIARAQVDDQLARMATAINQLVNQPKPEDDGTRGLLLRVAEGQDKLLNKLHENGLDGIDAESRMRLRSIDVQLLRILEEISAGRQESIADLRTDISGLARALRGRGRPGEGG